jgi:RNA 2',3'-cyclic 3'-phosphodiesterase
MNPSLHYEQMTERRSERLFFGIPVDDSVVELCNKLKLPLDGVRWIAPENLHITLIFIGNVSLDIAEQLKQIEFDRPASFSITVEKMEVKNKRAGLIWLKCSAPSQIKLLRNNLMQEILRYVQIKEENRPFTPHITIARSKGKIHYAPPDFSPKMFNVNSVNLYRSTMGAGGSKYEVVRGFEMMIP